MNTFKHIILIISLICISLANKGQIQFTLDQEKFDLLLDRVMVRVENTILISIRVELNNEKEMTFVNMEFALTSFVDKKALPDLTQLEVRIQPAKSRNVKLLSISGNKAQSTTIHDQMTGSSDITIQKTAYQNGHLELQGTFSFSYQSKEENKEVSINNGHFIIII
jgi:hypothetical protein